MGVEILGGKSPRGVIVQGVNGMGVKSWGVIVLGGKCPGGKRQGGNVRGVNGGVLGGISPRILLYTAYCNSIILKLRNM